MRPEGVGRPTQLLGVILRVGWERKVLPEGSPPHSASDPGTNTPLASQLTAVKRG